MTRYLTSLLDAINRYADKIAIVDCGGERQTTYHELYCEALKVAGFLQKNQIQKGSCITISLPQSMEYIAAEIGCWMSGCIAIPISDSFPRNRVDYIEKHCEAKLRIDKERLKQIDKENPVADIVECDEQDIICIFYTSGSTGEPKGVMQTYEVFSAFRKNSLAVWELTDADVIGHSSPFYFCASGDNFNALSVGATIHLYSEDVRRDVQLMAEYIKKWGITRCFMSPTVVAQYHNISDKLVLVQTASERLSGVKPEGFRLKNRYGSTETMCQGLCFEVDKSYENTPIGKPFVGLEVSIQDDDGNILPDGEEGEICLRGCFTPGYYKDTEKTASLWRESPQQDADGSHKKWLHTNDLGKILPDGNMLFVNRKDWMVKISGQRVEPGEVEAVMKRCPSVKNAVVKGFQNKKGGYYICGYYILDDGSQLTEDELEKFMRQYLTDYMIPTCFQRMDSFPLNPNGKLDRKSLVSPLDSPNTRDVELSSLETELKDIAARLLQTDDISVTDNLGYLGMTSILAAKFASKVYRKYSVQLDVRKLVKTSTIRSVAQEIGESEDKEIRLQKCVSVTHTEHSEKNKLSSAPLTFPQQGVYADCLKEPESLRYNLPFEITLPQSVTKDQLSRALKKFVNAHPYINCIFTYDGNEIVQKEIDNVNVLVKESEAGTVRPFNLETGPLYRFEILEGEELKLFVDFHHLIADGMSVDLFLSQLCLLLEGEEIDEEQYTYYDYANDERDLLRQNQNKPGPSYAETEQFYAERLSHVEEASMLIPDNYNPDGKHLQKSLFRKVEIKDMQKLSREQNITTASAFFSALAFAVSRFTAEETVGLCTISNGRSNSLITEDMGMFVNTLPLICQVKGEQTVADYLKETDNNFTSTILHEHYPFTRIAEKYGYAPNIMFAYQMDVFNIHTINGQELKTKSLEVDTAKFPIAVFIEGNSIEGTAQIHIDYDSDLYSEQMMTGFAESIDHILGELCQRQFVSEIDCCSENQIQQLDSFNDKTTDVHCEKGKTSQAGAEGNTDTGETVLSAFQKAAKQYPNNIAGVFKDKKYTYNELDELTDKIGAIIQSKIQNSVSRTKQEPVVSILIPRNEYIFILPLSAMKAGCAYQPLDPSYPKERLNFMVKDADAALLITDTALRSLISAYEGEVLLTTDFANYPKDNGNLLSLPSEGSKAENGIRVSCALLPSSLFILLYTSGSTGVPKGVMLEHGNLMAFIRWYRRYYELKPEHNVAAYASFGFDACMMDLYPALTTGATVNIIPEEKRLDLIALNDYFEQNNITHSFMTTQVGVQFLENTNNHSLLHLSVGGEKLVSVAPPRNYSFHNGYGPTECTIFSTIMPVLQKEHNIPIGKPVDSLKCFVLDKYLHRLPAGAAGELVIVGKQVGRGYLGQPEKTAESFFTYNGERAYHSGDIVRYREDGNIEFVGRKDGQVKIRGFRIELKEVEAVIREMQEISNVTVQAFDNPNGGKFIAAYIVMNEGYTFNAETVASYIRDRKPAYMVPASIMQLENIPYNVNQKVDKKALPAPQMQQKETDYVVPADELETTIAEAFAKVLGITEQVSALDSFSDLGGDSIKAIRLVTTLRQKNITLLVGQILQIGTVRGLADEVRNSVADEKQVPKFSQEKFVGEVEDTPLLSYFQNLHFAKPAYFNQAFLFRAKGQINVEAIKTALHEVIEHHDMLRASFAKTGVQVQSETLKKEHIFINNDATFDFEECTLTASEITSRCIDIQDSINLQNGPWVKSAVIHVEDSNYLFLAIHHLAVDGISWRIISEDLNIAYSQILSGEQVKLQAKTASYNAWTRALKEFRTSSTLSLQKPYWQDVCKRKSKCELSWNKQKGFIQKSIELSIESNIAEKLLTSSKKAYNTQTNDLFLSALSLAWNKLTDIENIAIQLEGHGRESFNPDILIDRTVGWFTSIYPVVLENITQDIRHTILSTKQTLRHIPQKGFGYPQLMGVDTKDVPLFTFNYLGSLTENNANTEFSICQDYPVGPFFAPENQYGTDICLNGYQTLDGSIIFVLDYNNCRFEESEMQKLGSLFVEAIEQIVHHTLSTTTIVKSASDLGETEWTQEEFDEISTEYMIHGENILSIHPLDENQINEVHRFILNPDIITSSVSPVFMLEKLGDKKVYEDILNILFRKQEYLRSTVAMYHLSIPRRIVSDKKPNILWYDFSEEHLSDKQQMEKVNSINEILQHFPYLPQDESPLRIALVKFADNIQYLVCCFHTLLFGVEKARNILVDLFKLVVDATGDKEAEGLIELLEFAIQSENSGSRSSLDTSSLRSSLSTEDIHIYNEHPGKKKLFFFHTANTGSEAYFNLAKRISNDCSFYAFEQYNLNHIDAPIEGGIPEIAAKYIEILRNYQPHGPYLIGGWCYGGTIAYEVAQQLVNAGEEIEHIIMLDSHIIDQDSMRDSFYDVLTKRNREYLSTADLFAGMRSKGLLELLIRNSIRTNWNWLHYEHQPYSSSPVTYFKATKKADNLLPTLSQMYDYILSESAGGYEKIIPSDRLSVFKVQEEHDCMMSKVSLDVIVPEILKILKQ